MNIERKGNSVQKISPQYPIIGRNKEHVRWIVFDVFLAIQTKATFDVPASRQFRYLALIIVGIRSGFPTRDQQGWAKTDFAHRLQDRVAQSSKCKQDNMHDNPGTKNSWPNAIYLTQY
jgi:hypothetical protein